jgi:hypothetical protein
MGRGPEADIQAACGSPTPARVRSRRRSTRRLVCGTRRLATCTWAAPAEAESFQAGAFQAGAFQAGAFQAGAFQAGAFLAGQPLVWMHQAALFHTLGAEAEFPRVSSRGG